MKIPINAYLGPVDFSIHVYIPPLLSVKAAPYSAIMSAKGIKNVSPDKMNQGMAA